MYDHYYGDAHTACDYVGECTPPTISTDTVVPDVTVTVPLGDPVVELVHRPSELAFTGITLTTVLMVALILLFAGSAIMWARSYWNT